MEFKKTKFVGFGMLCLVASPAFADVKIAELNDVSATVSQVTLTDTGVMTTTPRGGTGDTMVRHLSKANLDEALALTQVLGQAAITTDHRPSVCMMLAMGPGSARTLSVAEYDEAANRFVEAELHLVLTPSGCWEPTYTHPIEQSAIDSAKMLEVMLTTLADQPLVR